MFVPLTFSFIAILAYEQKDIITCINYCDEVLNTIDEPQDMNEKEQYSIAIGFKGFCQFSQELYFDALEAHQKVRKFSILFILLMP